MIVYRAKPPQGIAKYQQTITVEKPISAIARLLRNVRGGDKYNKTERAKQFWNLKIQTGRPINIGLKIFMKEVGARVLLNIPHLDRPQETLGESFPLQPSPTPVDLFRLINLVQIFHPKCSTAIHITTPLASAVSCIIRGNRKLEFLKLSLHTEIEKNKDERKAGYYFPFHENGWRPQQLN